MPSQVYGPSKLVTLDLDSWHRSKGSLMNLRYSVISTGNNETKVLPCEVILASGLGTDRLSNKDRSRGERRIQEV